MRLERAATAAALVVVAALPAGCAAGRWVDSTTTGNRDGGHRGGQTQRLLTGLETEPPGGMTGYDRDAFPHWSDLDGDGCDTRDEILARDLTHVTVGRDCEIVTGTLHGPYSGDVIRVRDSDADGIHVDHVVALAYAWRHGADEWGERRREHFANDPSNLLATDDGANIGKSDQGPADWRPDRRGFRCEYATIFIEAAAEYDLSITKPDRRALAGMLDTCPNRAP